jgi:D-alanine-D-alanine ligase
MNRSHIKIGITYDLRDDYVAEGYTHEETAEFDKEETIAGIENTIQKLGFSTQRIGNVKALARNLVDGKKWDIVFNITEGMYGLAREAQVPCLLDAWNIPYVFSDGLVMALTLHKGHTKRIIRDAGIPTAPFCEIRDEEETEKVNLPFPLFLKPVAEGTGKGISSLSKVNNKEELRVTAAYLLKQFGQPVLVETYLPGREFTVGIAGNGKETEALGVMEIVFVASDTIYSMEVKENYEELVRYRVPEKEAADACIRVALEAWKILGCVDGGRVDVRMDEKGIPNFIEVNPLAGLNPVHSDLPILCRLNGIDYEILMDKIIIAALKRNKIL